MRIFRVGGCVRDRAMGFTPKDIDYVVSGATEEEFVNSGVFGLTFTKVGADFPVFIDNNGDEWALARKERKSGTGYHGFEVEFDHSVTIEEDLLRRDLTINSMAEEIYDDMKTRLIHIIDPFNGQKDIENKILRHTSDAFQEDPVRVLRLARFRARFGKEWKVAKETSDLISQMAKKGVLDNVSRSCTILHNVF
jgi:tRNA nucleotidyltransferase (CCA-adding enzyme)